MASSSFSSTKFLCLLIIISLAVPGLAIDYYVGSEAGWCPSTNLVDWYSRKIFRVGDRLNFITPPSYLPIPVYLVPDFVAYVNCNVDAAIYVNKERSSVYTFSKTGPHYFIANTNYCKAGMKLNIYVNLPL